MMIEKDVTIHTHDRIAFKRCRRLWYLASPLGMNLEPISADKKLNLWFGSGFHFALEDYHGYRRFGHPEEAFIAYVNAFEEKDMPFKAAESIEIGLGMLAYYVKWLGRREQHKTLWLDGTPQVEVPFDLELTGLREHAGVPVYYHGTFDRVVVDCYNRRLVEDYKTAATVDLVKLSTDPQISAYLWAAPLFYGTPFYGMLYSQFTKKVPEEPQRLARGGFSKNKAQKTTHILYKEALIREYGKVPQDYIEFLNTLADQECLEGDDYIRKDVVMRTAYEQQATLYYMLGEIQDMITLSQMVEGDCTASLLYPNPTKDCSWDCPFRSVCIAMNEGADYDYLLKDGYKQRPKSAEGEKDVWRKRIKWPEA